MFAPAAPDAAPGPGVIARPPTWPISSGETTGSPMFLGNPPVPMPCSTIPAGPLRLAGTTKRQPPPKPKQRPPATPISELNHTASALAVYASQDGSLRRHARLAYHGPATPTAGFDTRRVPRKVSEVLLHTSSSFPRLHGARFVLYLLCTLQRGERVDLPRFHASRSHTITAVSKDAPQQPCSCVAGFLSHESVRPCHQARGTAFRSNQRGQSSGLGAEGDPKGSLRLHRPGLPRTLSPVARLARLVSRTVSFGRQGPAPQA